MRSPLSQKADHTEALGNPSSSALKTSSDGAFSPEITPEITPELKAAPGSSVAALWLQISQDQQLPASVPVKHPPQRCPHCHHPLNLLVEDFERQSCVKCGWSEPLRSPKVQDAGMLAELELKQLLEKASLESLSNMKSRQQNTP